MSMERVGPAVGMVSEAISALPMPVLVRAHPLSIRRVRHTEVSGPLARLRQGLTIEVGLTVRVMAIATMIPMLRYFRVREARQMVARPVVPVAAPFVSSQQGR